MLDLVIRGGQVVHPRRRRRLGRGHRRRAHRGGRASRHAAHRVGPRHRRDGQDRGAGRRRAPRAPGARDHVASGRAVPDARPRGGHRGHGVRRHDDPHRLRVRCGRAAISSRSSSSARRDGRAIPTWTTPSTSRWPAPSTCRCSSRSPRRSRRATRASRCSPPMSCRRIPSARAIASTSAASTTRWRRWRPPAASWWCTARTRTSSSSTTSASARRSGWRGRTSTSSTPSSRSRSPSRAPSRSRKATGVGVYFVHTSAREGVEAIRDARAQGLPIYGETLHQYACFNAEYYKTPRGFCSHTYPSLKLPEDQAALWHGLVVDGLSTLATDEYPTNLELKLRGKTIEDVTGGNLGAEARMGIGYSEGVVKRGMSLTPLRRRHRDQCREDLRHVSEKGRHRPGQRRRLLRDRSVYQEDAPARGLPRERLQPVGGLGGRRAGR